MTAWTLEREATGLEYLQRIIRGESPNAPIGETLGFRLVEAEPGRAVLTGQPDERSYNLIGTVHGGWAASILDTAMALGVLTQLDARHDFTTLDLKVNYLRPLTREAGVMRAEGHVIHCGRRVALAEARLVDGRGKLYAHGTSTCVILAR